MIFYLGTHEPSWLGRTSVPLFVSRIRLSRLKKLPTSIGTWALDSGAFTELDRHGGWTVTPQEYVAEVRRFATIGNMRWAAVQDWMCEPHILAKTGLTIAEHQRRTTHSYLVLKSLAPEVAWVPVLQGWKVDDYLAHAEEYNRALPFPLATLPLVGVGSVCRRQKTDEALEILRVLHALGLKLHGFGFKTDGLWNGGSYLLASADSMSWSRGARYEPPRTQHPGV